MCFTWLRNPRCAHVRHRWIQDHAPGPWSPAASHNSQLSFLLSGKPGSFSALGETPGLHHSLSAAYTESQN